MKMEKKLQKLCPAYYSLLIASGVCETHRQILSINFLKEFIKLNVNMGTMIKNVKLAELHAKYATVFLNTQAIKMI